LLQSLSERPVWSALIHLQLQRKGAVKAQFVEYIAEGAKGNLSGWSGDNGLPTSFGLRRTMAAVALFFVNIGIGHFELEIGQISLDSLNFFWNANSLFHFRSMLIWRQQEMKKLN